MITVPVFQTEVEQILLAAELIVHTDDPGTPYDVTPRGALAIGILIASLDGSRRDNALIDLAGRRVADEMERQGVELEFR